METTEWIWKNGTFVKWEETREHVLTHTLHYGAGAFEGIRAYKTDDGPAVFRLREHIDRLFYSSKAINLAIPYSPDDLVQATVDLLKQNQLDQCYIRPLVYFGYGVMGLNPRNAPTEVAIVCWPWGAYLPHEMVDLKVSNFIRIHPKSTVADAKICGHYVNSIMAVLELRDTKYHEALLLDYDGYVAEGPGENLFLVKDGVLITPQLGTILAGITRDSVKQIAAKKGYQVEERRVTLDEVYAADEAFYTGTAAEITPIRSVDDRVIGAGEVGPLTREIKSEYLDIVHGRKPEYREWLTYVR